MATSPVPKANPKDFNQERYDRLTKNLLEIIASNEGTYNSDLIPEKAKEIIKTPYDMVYGHGKYLFPNKPPTEMTIREVIDFGRPLVNKTIKSGLGSSAMGKYQVMANSYKRNKPNNKGVLEEFANKLNLDIDTQLFTPEIQDAIAIRMLEERVPSLKDFATSETDENLNKVLDELNATWRGVPDSKNETSEGQSLQGLSAEEIGDELKRIKYVEGGTFDPMGSKKTDYSETDRMLQDNKIDEQEINAGDNSLENQRERQRAITKQKSGFNLISPAEGADLERINRTVTEEINKVDPIDADSTRDRMEVITPPTNAASDAFQTDQMMEDYNTVNKDEELFRGSMNEDTEVEPLGDMSYPEGYTEYDSENNVADEQEFDEPDTVVDREGMDYSEPEVVGDTSFFESLFTDIDTDYNFEVDDLNLEEGGSVEKKANFDGKEEEVEEEVKADPPPGAKPSEVADDIPAMLSEGEYVLPANVVRYLGLERIIDMHRQVLCEIQQMEDLGMIQNVDENGKPEEDDKEMQFAEDAPSAGAIEIIVASPKPKGIMSFDSGGAFEFDSGGAEGGRADYDSGYDAGYDTGGSGGSDGSDGGDFFDNFVEGSEAQSNYLASEYGGGDFTSENFNRPEFSSSQMGEEFGDDPSGLNFEKNSSLLAKEITDDPEKKEVFYSSMENAMKALEDKDPTGSKIIGGVMQMIGLGRVVTGLEEFNNFMSEKRLEARNEAADKARAEGKSEQEIQDAMNAAWASPGFSAAEDAAFEGQFNEVSGYANTGSKFYEGPLKVASNFIKKAVGKVDVEKDTETAPNNKVKYPFIGPQGSSRLPAGTAGADSEYIFPPEISGLYQAQRQGFASGGLMQKKKFNQGGAYIEGVGYRDITQPMSLDSAFDTEVKTYEDIIAEMQGFTGRDKAPEQENLDRKQGKLRRQRSRELPYLKAGNPNPKISRRDPYLDLQLRNAGVDVEEFGDVIQAYREGKTRILPRSSPTGNRQLIKTLDNYTESKRMQYDGFTQKDLNNLPEGATNREVLKKIFNTELQFRDGKFGYAGDEQDMANVGEEVGKAAPLGATGAPFRPMQGARFKEMYLEEFDPNNSKAIELKLDEKADIEQINRATSFLNTQGDEKYIDPNHPMYIDNIFREFNGFRGTGLWELDSKRDPLKTTSSALMGNQYVEGVGYRT